MLFIRQETPQDFDAVYALVKRAFAQAPHRDGHEQDLVAALRSSDAFVPALSLVAASGDQLIGHVLFTEARVDNQPVLALAPLSVLPAYQRQGVGTALLREGHRIASALGYGYSVVLGDAAYYPRVGYAPAALLGIRAPFDVPAENFMAIRLRADAPPACPAA
nr:N-acetyltransferase [Maliibacterium massiliense]